MRHTFDDEIDTAGSLVGGVDTLLKFCAREVYASSTHPVFSEPAVRRITQSPVKEVVVTGYDTCAS